MDLTTNKQKHADLWVINLNKHRHLYLTYLSLLSNKEKMQSNKFHFTTDKENFTIRRAILKIILSKYLNIKAHEIKINVNKHQKPLLSNNQNLAFNTSHADFWLIIGIVKDNSIGVDIEKNNPIKRHDDFIKEFMSNHEIKQFKKLNTKIQLSYIYKTWCRKEAIAKYLGNGFTLNPQKIETAANNHSDIKLHQLDILENYTVIVSTSVAIQTIDIYQYNDTNLNKIEKLTAKQALNYTVS